MDEAGTIDATLELLTFHLSKEEYAFRIDDIQEIIRPIRITRIPKAECSLLGITSLRGKIIPVIDLKRRLSLHNEGDQKKRRKILIVKGPKGPIGAMIDKVIGVIRPLRSRIVDTPLHVPEAERRFIEGIVVTENGFISLMRTEEVMNITLTEEL